MAYAREKSSKLDFIFEIGNIGSGNALTALASLINRRVDMPAPILDVLDYDQLLNSVGGSEYVVSGFLINITGDINGLMLFLLQQDFAKEVCEILLNNELIGIADMSDLEVSLFKEIANIMAASYVTALSDLTGMKISISTPALAIDMAGAILSVPMIHFENLYGEVVTIQNTFVIDAKDYNSSILFFLDDSSVVKLLDKFGIGQ